MLNTVKLEVPKKRQRKERHGGLNLVSKQLQGCLSSVLRCLYIKQCSYLLFFFHILESVDL